MKPHLHVFNYQIFNAANDSLEINIDGYIVDSPTQELMREWYGDETSVSYKSIRDQIQKASPKTLNVYVNSGGGHVGDAMAIHDFLVDLQKNGVTVNTFVRGIVASAATYIVMSSKNSTMSENSWMMIHNVSGGIWGNVNEIENYAATMRKFNDQVTNFYSNRSGLSKNKVAELMNSETWMSAAEAKENGFVSNVSGTENFTNCIKPEHWQFNNQAVLNAYNQSVTNKNDDMDLKKITDAVSNGIKEAFAAFRNAKPEDQANAEEKMNQSIHDSISNALAPLANLEETISNAVTTAVSNLNLAEMVNNAVNTATTGFATAEAVNKLEQDIANKLGGKPAGEKPENESGKVLNKKSFFQRGEFAE